MAALGVVVGCVEGLLAIAPVDADKATMEKMDSDMHLVAINLRSRLTEPRLNAVLDLGTDCGIGVEVGQLVGQALEMVRAPLLASRALENVILGLLVLAQRAKVAGGTVLVMEG